MAQDNSLGDHRDLGYGLVQKVQRCLLIAKEAAVEHGALVAGIGAGHRETARERGTVAGVRATKRRLHAAVQSAPALEQEAAVPVRG